MKLALACGREALKFSFLSDVAGESFLVRRRFNIQHLREACVSPERVNWLYEPVFNFALAESAIACAPKLLHRLVVSKISEVL